MPTGSGVISLTSFQGATSGQASTAASFHVIAPTPPPNACTSLVAGGACELFSCPLANDGHAASSDDAGTITVTGGTSTVHLAFEASSKTYHDDLPVPSVALWSGGEALVFSGSGGAVPPFENIVVAAPAPVSFTKPALSPPAALDVDTNHELPFAWDHGMTPDRVLITVSVEDDSRRFTASCSFAAEAGRGAVPASLLAQLRQRGKVGGVAVIKAQSRQLNAASAGSYSLAINASTIADNGAGSPYTGTASLH